MDVIRYRLSKFVAFTAANTLVFRASPAIGIERGWLYVESCIRSGEKKFSNQNMKLENIMLEIFYIFVIVNKSLDRTNSVSNLASLCGSVE